MALDKILNLAISYPDFKLNQIIDPEQFDLNNKQLVDKINQIVGAINSLTQPGGAGNIGITPLPEFPETTDLEGVLRCILDYAIENRTQLGALGDEIDVLFRDVYATITTIQGKNKEQDDKLAGLKVVDEINDARVGIVEGRVKTVEERTTDLEVRIDGLEETNANVEITSARTSGINGQTYQTIGKRIDDLEIGHDKIIPTGKRGRFNFVITDEESTKTWEDSVKQVALDTHEKDPSAHNLLFAGHELDETSHQDIRDEVERVSVNAGTEVSETQPTSGSKVWIENMGQNDLTNFNARHNVKNKEGEYDTYHFETNDEMVVMESGKTLAQEMAEVKASGTPKEKRYYPSDITFKTYTCDFSNISNEQTKNFDEPVLKIFQKQIYLKQGDIIKIKLHDFISKINAPTIAPPKINFGFYNHLKPKPSGASSLRFSVIMKEKYTDNQVNVTVQGVETKYVFEGEEGWFDVYCFLSSGGNLASNTTDGFIITYSIQCEEQEVIR